MQQRSLSLSVLFAYFFLLLIILEQVYAAFSLTPATEIEGHGMKGKCYYMRRKKAMKPGQHINLRGCARVTCVKLEHELFFRYESCGAMDRRCAGKRQKKPYPDCCPINICALFGDALE